MNNMYNAFKTCLNNIEEQINNEQNSSVDGTAHQNHQTDITNSPKPINNLIKTEIKSTLSPLAPSFAPRFVLPIVQQQPQSINENQNLKFHNNPQLYVQEESQKFSNYETENYSNNYLSLDNNFNEEDLKEDYIALNELKDFIENISKCPASYESDVDYITNILHNWIGEDPDIIMECVVNNIMDQAIIDTNFCYNGVRFCLHLSKQLTVSTSKGSFKDILLQRCKREHSRRASLSTASDKGVYLRGLTFFIADLSTKLNENVLTLQVPDLLKTLIENKSPDNIKCCCQILKLCGKYLTEYFKNEDSVLQIIDSLFDELNNYLKHPESEKLSNMIKDIIELYKNNWVPPSSNNSYIQNYDYNKINSQVACNYDFGPCGDENNDDVCDAFEEFLKSSGQLD